MAEEKEKSLWTDILNTYRDIEVAKRSQPKLVQGAQQVAVPFQQNVSGPQQPQKLASSNGSVLDSPMLSQYLLWGGFGLLTVALIFKFKG